jgi:hypothetical protein
LGFAKTYDYDDVPTVRKFNQDNRFFRSIMGPVGSGKSSGCVAEIIDRGIAQEPDRDGVRRTRWAVVRHCYDDQTEILTEQRGWQLFKDLLPLDKVASLVDNELIFVVPSKHYQYDYSGEMISFENEGVDFCVTPEHQMYIQMRNARKKSWEGWRTRPAAEIFGNVNTRVKRDAQWAGVAPPFSIAFMEWFGFWMAEGCAASYNYDGYDKKRCVISQKNNLEYVRGLFEKAGIPYSETGKEGEQKTFWVRMNGDTKPMVDWLMELGKSTTKRVPQWLKDSPPEHITEFFKGYLAGDGSHCKRNRVTAVTSSRQLADDIQELALRAGMVVNITKANSAKPYMVINGVETKQNADVWNIAFLSKSKFTPMLTALGYADKYEGWQKTVYSGKVYCVEVPSHVVYVRRNSKAFWCSQSYRALLDTTMETLFMWLPPEHFGNFSVTNFQYNINKIDLGDGTKVDIEIIFRALDKPEQVRNLLSLELTGAWFYEIREVAWIILENMEHRVGRYPSLEVHGVHPTWHGIIADTNPPDVDSKFYHFFEEDVVKDPMLQAKYVLYKQPSGRSEHAENKRHLIPNYYENLMIGKEPEFIKVYVDGDYGYIRDGKPVYGNYLDHMHCAQADIRPIGGMPIIIGMDFALNPCAVFCQLTPHGNFNVIKEIVGVDMGLRRFVNDLMRPYIFSSLRGFEIIIAGDPAGVKRTDNDERSSFDELRMQGLPAIPAHTNSFLARYNAVDSMLTKMVKGIPAFQLSPGCKVLRKGFMGEYKLKKYRGFGEDRYSDIPVKNEFSHPHDALQYACMVADRGEQIARSYQHMGSRYAEPASPRPAMSGWT